MLGVTLGPAATSFSTQKQTVEKSSGRESSTFAGQAGDTYYYITPLVAAICGISGGFKSSLSRNRTRPGTWKTTRTILNKKLKSHN